MSAQADFKNKSQEQMIEYAVRMRKRAEKAEEQLEAEKAKVSKNGRLARDAQNREAASNARMRAAVLEAIQIAENCCGCLYVSDEDGRVYALRTGEEVASLTAALQGSA